MNEYVRYIDRTREYYLAQGYRKPYEWAHFDEVPFMPLEKPLAECRVGLVSTSDVGIRSADGEGRDKSQDNPIGNVYSVPTDTPVEKLFSRQESYDKYATHLDDVNSYFPVSRLDDKVNEGRLGSLAPRCHGVYTSYSHRRTSEDDAPEVLKRCREDGVDVAILTPV